jgi:hypothetical protein
MLSPMVLFFDKQFSVQVLYDIDGAFVAQIMFISQVQDERHSSPHVEEFVASRAVCHILVRFQKRRPLVFNYLSSDKG